MQSNLKADKGYIINSLNPDLYKTKFSHEEDFIILESYNRMGSKWTKIYELLKGRNGDTVKKSFYAYLRNESKATVANCKLGSSNTHNTSDENN